MSTIRETVEQSLRASGRQQYISYADGVVSALEQREEQIKAGLRQAAQQRGLSATQIADLFTQVGLEQRPQVTTTHPNTPGDDAAILQRLETLSRRVEDLVSAARRHGVTV